VHVYAWLAGTLDYMAPEVLVCPDKKLPTENKDKASLAYGGLVDAWACGILAYELIAGHPPFEHESRSTTYQYIMYRDPKYPPSISAEARNFISSALTKVSMLQVALTTAGLRLLVTMDGDVRVDS